MIDINKITEIRNRLKMFYGSYKRVAKKADVSTEMVRLVMLGERTSQKVVVAAAAVLVELTQEEAERKMEVEQSLQKVRELHPAYSPLVAAAS